MKRTFLISLCLLLLLPQIPISDAAEIYSLQELTVISEVAEALPQETVLTVIENEGEIYIKCADLGTMTRYRVAEDENQCAFVLGEKYVIINYTRQTLKVNNNDQAFSGAITHDGQKYLPLSEVLPWLNVTWHVENGMLYTYADAYSFWEATVDFNPSSFHVSINDLLGDNTAAAIHLIAIGVMDNILNLDDLWKRAVPLSVGKGGSYQANSSIYDYEQYVECLKEFILDGQDGDEVAEIVSELTGKTASSADFIKDSFEIINGLSGFADNKIGEDMFALDNILPESLPKFSEAMKNINAGLTYLRIMITDTSAYQDAISYLYLRPESNSTASEKKAAKEMVDVCKSNTNAAAIAGKKALRKYFADVREDYAKSLADDLIFESVNEAIGASVTIYTEAIDAGLSLFWPVNKAWNEISKINVYQAMESTAESAYHELYAQKNEMDATDISRARISALFFLRSSKKILEAQDKWYSAYGGKGIFNDAIMRVDRAIQKFEICALSIDNDSMENKAAKSADLKVAFRDLQIRRPNEKSPNKTGGPENATQMFTSGNWGGIDGICVGNLLYVIVDGKGLLEFNKGAIETICEGNFSPVFCTNGSVAYVAETIGDASAIMKIDLHSRTKEILFQLEKTSNISVPGADKEGLYLACWNEDTDSPDIIKYDYSGNELRTIKSGCEMIMRDGIILLRSRRWDVTPPYITAIGPDGGSFIDNELAFGAEIIDGAVYHLPVDADWSQENYTHSQTAFIKETPTMSEKIGSIPNGYYLLYLHNGVCTAQSDDREVYYRATTGELIADSEDVPSRGDADQFRPIVDQKTGETYFISVYAPHGICGSLYKKTDTGWVAVIEQIEEGAIVEFIYDGYCYYSYPVRENGKSYIELERRFGSIMIRNIWN